MSTDRIHILKDKHLIDGIMRWFLFCVFLVAGPPLLHGWYKIIVGLTFNYVECVPDMLLVVLSVCCNLINICIDSEKKIAYILRWIFGIIFGTISFGCWGLFIAIRFLKENIISDNIAHGLFLFSTVIILICSFVAIIIEFYTAKNNNIVNGGQK